MQILSIAHYQPKKILSSMDVEEIIMQNWYHDFSQWIIEELTWVKNRFYCAEDEYSSTLAINAWKKAIKESGINKESIDLLIFASAAQDIIEPATANIVQQWLWLKCPVFDIKNACNSFLNALEISDSLLRTWAYKRILICSWETWSKVVKFDVKNRNEFKEAFSWYTLWDWWSAMIAIRNPDKWIKYSSFTTDWSYWDTTTIMWWGSRYPRTLDKNYFLWNMAPAKEYIMKVWKDHVLAWFNKTKWAISDVNKYILHQVSMEYFDIFCEQIGIEKEKVPVILSDYGNIAASSIPTCLSKEMNKWSIKPWDKIVLVGFAAWVSLWVLFLEL